MAMKGGGKEVKKVRKRRSKWNERGWDKTAGEGEKGIREREKWRMGV